MNISIRPNADHANDAAAVVLAEWLTGGARNVMLAAGRTPLELYRRVGQRAGPLPWLHLFALDEYAGVPLDEPLNCAHVIRRAAVGPWSVPESHYHWVSSLEADALESVLGHERIIQSSGGLDVVVLGLGQNGHLGFNEPGSAEDSTARVLDLDPVSVEANRQWFGGRYAPSRGATVGLKTILAARRVLLMAFGPHKAAAVKVMLQGPRTPACPASFLQGHGDVRVFLDEAAASTHHAWP